MMQDDIYAIYMKLKLYYYRRIFRRMSNLGEDSLTALETLTAEAIYGLGRPTLTEFAEFINISTPNANYRIASLEKKGYVKKTRSETDGRVSYLEVTDKYLAYYGSSRKYSQIIARRIERRFPEEDVAKLEEILNVVSEELMREVNRYLSRSAHVNEDMLHYEEEDI